MDLLFIPALAKAEVCYVLLPSTALLLDMNDKFEPLGRASINEDGLYPIGTRGTAETEVNDEKKAFITHVLKSSSLQTSVSKVDFDEKS